MEKFAADPAVETDAVGHVLDIGADLFAQIGDLVDKGDLGGQKSVGRVFDQFRGLDIGKQHRRLEQVERAVQGPHRRLGALAVAADHHPVGPHEIGDRRALAQEFRVRGDIETALRPRPAQDFRHSSPGADRHRRLGHDHGVIGQRPPDLLCRGEDIGKVGMAVAAPRRGADSDEYGVDPVHRRAEIGGEQQPFGRRVLGHQRVEPGLEDRHLVALQPGDLGCILVDAGDGHPKLGKAGPGDQADIPRSDHRYAHIVKLRLDAAAGDAAAGPFDAILAGVVDAA